MKCRIDMPNGLTLRIASQRRYIVTTYRGALAKWEIEYRTDTESRALARWREEARRGSVAHVIDTGAKEIIR